MHKKRAQSRIVSTVLIILLIVAAIAILGIIILRLVNTSSSKLQSTVNCQGIMLTASQCIYNSSHTYGQFQVKYGATNATLMNITFILYSQNGGTVLNSTAGYSFGNLQTNSFLLSKPDNGANPTSKFSLYATIKNQDGSIANCQTIPPITCSASTVPSSATFNFATPPAPANGICSGSLNNCDTGNPINPSANSTHYLWQCQGTNGGTTANCSLPIGYLLNVNVSAGGFANTTDGKITNCISLCTTTYNSGQAAVINSYNSSGYLSPAWTGCDSNTTSSCTLTMNSNRTVNVKFNPAPLSAPASISAITLSNSSINVSWASVSGATGYSFYKNISNVFINIVNTSSLSYLDSGLASNTTYNYRVSAFNTMVNSSFSATASNTTFVTVLPYSIREGLLVYYHFNGNTNDNSTNNNPGYVQNYGVNVSSIQYVTGKSGSAANFSHSINTKVLSLRNPFNTSRNDSYPWAAFAAYKGSVALWIQPNQNFGTSGTGIIDLNPSSSCDIRLYGEGGAIKFDLSADGPYNCSIGDWTNQWHFVALTWDAIPNSIGEVVGGTMKLYLDGSTPCATRTFSYGNCAPRATTMQIGALNADNYWWNAFNGAIDEVMAFNRTLNSTDIATIYSQNGLI